MLRTLKNRVKSMDAVYKFCLENPEIIEQLAALGISVTALGVNIGSIRSKEALQEYNYKGVTRDKKVLKTNMVKYGSALAQAGQSYAAANNNNTLFDKLSYSESKILNGTGISAISLTEGVYTLLNEIPVADRTPVGLTDAALDGLEDVINNFADALNNTNLVRSNRKNYTKELQQLVNEGSGIMRKRVLTAAKQLAVRYPEFYSNLINLSKVVNAHTHTKARIEVFSEITGKALEGATVTVVQTGEDDITSKKGLCSFYLPFGEYTLDVKQDGYMPMSVNVKIKKGSNTIHVDMTPEFIIPAETVVTENKKVKAEKVAVKR